MVFSYSILSIIVIFCTSCLCRKSFGRSGPETLTILDSNMTWKGWSRGDLDSFFYYKNYEELKESLPSDVPFLIDFDWSSASSTYGAIWAVFNTENGTRISTLNFDPNQNKNGHNTGAGEQSSKSSKVIDFLILSIYLHDKSYIFPYKGPRTSNEVIRKISHEDTELQKFYNISIPIGAPSFTLEFGVSATSLIYIDKMSVVFKSKVKPTTPSRVYTIGTTPTRPSITTSGEITQQQPKFTTLLQTKPSSTSTLSSSTKTATIDHDRDVYKYMVDPTFVKKDTSSEPTFASSISISTINTSSKSETEEKSQFEEETPSTSAKTTEISAGTSVEVENEAELTSSSSEQVSSTTRDKSISPSDKMGKIIDDSSSSSSTSTSGLGLDTDSSSYSTVNSTLNSTTSTTTPTTSSTTSKSNLDEITTTNANKKTSKNKNKNTGNQKYLSFTCLFVFTIMLIIMR